MSREQYYLYLGAGILAAVAAVVGLVVYGLTKADVVVLRWWAGVATLAWPVGVGVAYGLGRQAAKERIAGLQQGIEAVTAAANRTVETARETAAVRLGVAQAMRRPVQPAIQQVFLPGLGAGQGPVILPAARNGEEVEL